MNDTLFRGCLSLILCALPLSAHAEPLTADQALARAAQNPSLCAAVHERQA